MYIRDQLDGDVAPSLPSYPRHAPSICDCSIRSFTFCRFRPSGNLTHTIRQAMLIDRTAMVIDVGLGARSPLLQLLPVLSPVRPSNPPLRPSLASVRMREKVPLPQHRQSTPSPLLALSAPSLLVLQLLPLPLEVEEIIGNHQ